MLLNLVLACADPTTDTAPKDSEEAVPLGFCDAILGGTASGRDAVLDLGEAHGRLRAFGDDEDASVADLRLAAALADAAPSDDATLLAAYVAAEDGRRCVVPPGPALGAAAVEVNGDGVAWITPGTGAVSLTGSPTAVVVDLRDVPAGPDADVAIRAVLETALATDVTLPEVTRRAWSGWVDQVFTEANVYSVSREGSEDVVTGVGTTDLPLFFVVGTRISPEAARWAMLLRAAGRAAIVGEPIAAAMGEMEWRPVGASGIAYRARETALPDEIAADLPTDDPEALFAGAAPEVALAALSGDATRPKLEKRKPWDDPGAMALDPGAERAALLTVYGTLRTFYPYTDELDAELDTRLVEVLDAVGADDARTFGERLGRLGEVLHDGHCFFGSLVDDGFVGYAPVQIEHVDGVPVVKASHVDGIVPGDVLVAIDGVDVATLEDDYRAWNGAATEGYTLDLIARRLVYLYAPTAIYTVEGDDGTEADVTVEAGDFDETLWYAADHENGMIDGDVAYLNLDYAFTLDTDEISELLAASPRGVILDMRGYPGINQYEVPPMITAETSRSPIFNTPLVTVDSTTLVSEQYELPGSSDPYTGPVVLLVGPHSVSAAENLSQMLVDTGRVTVVGGQSAGTNGNITGARVLGDGYFTWTGMELLNPDGTDFMGVGIQPDVEVAPTREDLRDGLDPVLDAALALL